MKNLTAMRLIEDVVQIAKWYSWGDKIGRSSAKNMLNDIHGGKYGSVAGAWVQAENAMNVLWSNYEG